MPMATNINKKGNNTKNHDTPANPDLQMRFNMNVQNTTYKNFAINIKATFCDGQLKLPKQYLPDPSMFCKSIATKATIEIVKYTNAGLHKLWIVLTTFIIHSMGIIKMKIR